MHAVVETAACQAAAKSAGMTDEEREEAINVLANYPQAGAVMQGTGGCRKVRIAGRGKSKSGGYRVITAFGGGDIPVFLLTMFGKDEKDNLSKAERNELAKLTRVLFESYGKKR